MKPAHWAFLLILVLPGLTACDSAPIHEALPPGSVVLALGDSITHGTGAGRGEDYPSLLAGLSGWLVVNAGVPGDTAGGAGKRLPALLDEHQPDLVIVELGGNDFLRKRPESAVRGELHAIITRAQQSGALVALVAVPRLSLLRAGMGALEDSAIYGELARETGAVPVADILSGVLSDDDLRADRIHPNAEGYRVFAEGLADALRRQGLLL